MVLDGKSSQIYSGNAGDPQSPIFGPTLFLLQINDLSVDAFCNIAVYGYDTTFHSKGNSHLIYLQICLQELSSELESDLEDYVDWGSK